jgi:hypothetical protein
MKLIKSVCLACLLSLYSTTAFAIDPIPEESGFSGFLSLGLGANRMKNNMVSGNMMVDISDSTISSYTSGPSSETEMVPAVNFELKYTFGNTRTQIFLGNSLEDVLRFDLSTQLGVRQDLKEFGIVAAGFVFNGIATEVWKDPYDTTQKRDETDKTSNGIRLTWDKIMGSRFQIEVTFRDTEIDKERSGMSLALTPAQRDMLSREGDFFKTEALYRFKLNETQWLVPALIFKKDDLDGDAMSADTFDFQLTYLYTRDRISLIVNGMIGTSENDKRNPIYNKTQEDDRYGATFTAFYRMPDWKPLGSQTFSFWGNAGYFNSDANISFYETEAVFAGAGVMLKY